MDGAPFESKRCRDYVGKGIVRFETDSSLTAIIILALVAIFIGLRLYSVLGERTGHEQPILKPADPEADARMEPQPHARTTPSVSTAEPDELAYLPMAGLVIAFKNDSRVYLVNEFRVTQRIEGGQVRLEKEPATAAQRVSTTNAS